MLIVLSPAKSLDYETPAKIKTATTPQFMAEAAVLAGIARQLSPEKLGELMSISPALAQLNADRFADWSENPAQDHVKQAVLAFNGDVYDGLDANHLNSAQMKYVQNHVRILSGLYGLLRPLDMLQPYRLEMGTSLLNPAGKNLYAYWGNKVTDALNEVLSHQQSKILINLASEEYFKVVKPALLCAPVITPIFQDWKNGKYKIISFFAKRARGLMARYCALHGIRRAGDLKSFDVDGYAFCEEESTESHWVFRRRSPDA
ncbi:MAG: peroxide stress protein YaaA [Burkholderiales bacterium]|nr:peroxide stress protein YaaA [Burkholderiales bacterium]